MQFSDDELAMYTSKDETRILCTMASDIAVLRETLLLARCTFADTVEYTLSDGKRVRCSLSSAAKLLAARESTLEARRELYIDAVIELRLRAAKREAEAKAAAEYPSASDDSDDDDGKVRRGRGRKRTQAQARAADSAAAEVAASRPTR